MSEPAEPAAPELGGTRCLLVELDGEPLDPAGDEERAPFLELDVVESRVSGSGGCNRLVVGVELEDDALRFGPLAMTRMACSDEVMELERRFLAALAATEDYVLEDDVLALLDAEGVLARLAARPSADE